MIKESHVWALEWCASSTNKYEIFFLRYVLISEDIFPAEDMVVIITLELSIFCFHSESSNVVFTIVTIGKFIFWGTISNVRNNPKVLNFLYVWVRRASEGTITKTFWQVFAIKKASIVSVFPVPVGITTIALSSPSSAWASKACKAPICGERNPWCSPIPFLNRKRPFHDSTILLGVRLVLFIFWKVF